MMAQVFGFAKQQPQWLALDILGKRLSYRDLWLNAQQQAATLQHIQIQPSRHRSAACGADIVALHLAKSCELVVMQLACWMAGLAFMPLPLDWPQQRKYKALQIANCHIVVSEQQLPGLDCQQITTAPLQTGLDQPLRPFKLHAQQAAYAIFTSGSSGEPKGVLIDFPGLAKVIQQQVTTVQLQAQQRVLWLHDMAFDASIADIWVSLSAGACLIAKKPRDSQALTELIYREAINYIDLPAALLPYLRPEQMPASLHTLLVGGEVANIRHLSRWAKHTRVVIAYGPSEATICSSMHIVGPEETRPGLIGLPLHHLQYLIAAIPGHSPSANRGELIIRGASVARGYFGDIPENKRFSLKRQVRQYRSGDVVRALGDSYQFIGRIDRQFKFRGKLIAPEEIERQLLTLPAITAAYVFYYRCNIFAAVATEEKEEKKKKKEEEKEQEHVAHLAQQQLQRKLPTWMHPAHYLCLHRLPRKAGGKIHLSALEKRAQERLDSSDTAHSHPLVAWVCRVLQITTIDTDKSIAAYHPDSLQVLALIAALGQQGFAVSRDELLANQSLARFISRLQGLPRKQAPATPVALSCQALKRRLTRYPRIKINHADPAGEAIFLTGATGNLGRQLLNKLSAQNSPVICLVRGGEARLQQQLKAHGIRVKRGNVRCFNGDIRDNQLGLSANQWAYLCANVKAIFHCAADTSLLKTAAELEASNVKGTHHVLQLLEQGCGKQLHYASTLAIVIDSSCRHQYFNEATFFNRGEVYGGYAQSKWQAEALVREHSHCFIYRFGLLVNSQASPHTGSQNNAARDWFEYQLLQHHSFNHAPATAQMDFTPITYASELMLGIAANAAPGVFHVHNPQALHAQCLRRAIHRVAKRLQHRVAAEDGLPGLASHSPLRLFKMSDTHIDSQQSLRIARDLGITCPNIDSDYLERYLETLWLNHPTPEV